MDPRVAGITRMTFGRYDRNGNNVLEREEWSGSRMDLSPADADKDNRITREELGAWLATRFRGFGGDRGGGRSFFGWGRRRGDGDSGEQNFYSARRDSVRDRSRDFARNAGWVWRNPRVRGALPDSNLRAGNGSAIA